MARSRKGERASNREIESVEGPDSRQQIRRKTSDEFPDTNGSSRTKSLRLDSDFAEERNDNSEDQPNEAEFSTDQTFLRDGGMMVEASLEGVSGVGFRNPPQGSDETVIRTVSSVNGSGQHFSGGSLAELAESLVGQQIDDLHLETLIAIGGMGAVFKAQDLKLSRVVAVKIIPSAQRDEDSIRRFRVEAQSAAKLDHPGIARVYYTSDAGAWSYIVLEYVEGTNLRDLVASHGPLTVDDAVYVTRQIADAIDHASSRGVVHRDIKPSNVLMTNSGQVKLVDLGLARTTSAEKSVAEETASGVTLGTFDYIAPEQARDPRSADVRSDIYSLGCTLYYLLSGDPPFPEGTALQKLLNHGSENPDSISELREDVSRNLEAILAKMMAKKPVNRYQRPQELISDLMVLAEMEGLAKSGAAAGTSLYRVASEPTNLERLLPWIGAIGVAFFIAIVLAYSNQGSELSVRPAATFEAAGEGSELDKSSSDESPQAFRTTNAILGDTSERTSKEDIAAEAESSVFARPPGNRSLGNELLENGPQGNGLVGPAGGPSPIPMNWRETVTSLFNDAQTRDGESAKRTGFPDVNTIFGAGAGWSESVVIVTSIVEENTAASDGQIVATLEEAVGIAHAKPQIQEIWIAKDYIECPPLGRLARSVRIVAAPRFEPTLRFLSRMPASGEPSRSETGDTQERNRVRTFIEIGNQELEIAGLRVIADLHNLSDSASVFTIGNGGSLAVNDCWITISGDASVDGNILSDQSSPQNFTNDSGLETRSKNLESTNLQSTNRAGNGSEPDWALVRGETDERGEEMLSERINLDFEDSVVRGVGSWLVLDRGMRTQASWRNGLLVVTGHMVETAGTTSLSKTLPTVRIDLEQVTSVTHGAMAKMELSAETPFPVVISRSASNCVFWSEPGNAIFMVVGMQQASEAERILSLRGENNAYDSGIVNLVEFRNQVEKLGEIDFQAMNSEIFLDRASESAVIWDRDFQSEIEYWEATPAVFTQRQGGFMPGFNQDALPSQ